MPKLMSQHGIIQESDLKGRYCIALDKLDEKSYDRLSWGVAYLIYFIQIVNGILGVLIVPYYKNDLIRAIWFICLVLNAIPWILPIAFHAKSVFTIYKITKTVPSLEVNLTMMTLHMVVIFFLSTSIIAQLAITFSFVAVSD